MILFQQHIFRKEYADANTTTPSEHYQLWIEPMLARLLEAGADLTLKDDAGRTVLDYLDAEHDFDYHYKRAHLEQLVAAP
jgi:hypothetical protein